MEREETTARPACVFLQVLLVVAGIMALMTAVPYALLWILFWAASDSWDFEGDGSLKHWLLVKGSNLDRVGLVAQTERPARYSVRFQEGTFPGWRVVGYESVASPQHVIATYADRCNALGFRVTRREPADSAAGDPEKAYLECEIEPYIDVQVSAERKVSATLTDVSMRVWGTR